MSHRARPANALIDDMMPITAYRTMQFPVCVQGLRCKVEYG